MKYETGGAFRQALEVRLRAQSIASGMPLVRLRKMIAFERFLARLIVDQPDQWVLKGGFALQLRLGERARTTKDVDLLMKGDLAIPEIHNALVHAGLVDLDDAFQFQVTRPGAENELRFPVVALLDGRPFEPFHVDVGLGDPLTDLPESLTAPAWLEFAEIAPVAIPCYPLALQIAEKVHAYTRMYFAGASSRVKDWVDILLMASLGRMEAKALVRALRETFDARGTHPLPTIMLAPSSKWQSEFRRMARDTGLGYATLSDATEAMARFLNPIFGGGTTGAWNPATWTWE